MHFVPPHEPLPTCHAATHLACPSFVSSHAVTAYECCCHRLCLLGVLSDLACCLLPPAPDDCAPHPPQIISTIQTVFVAALLAWLYSGMSQSEPGGVQDEVG